jgi:hypothetical protein
MKPANSYISATPSHVLIFSNNAVDTVACLTCVPSDEPTFSYLFISAYGGALFSHLIRWVSFDGYAKMILGSTFHG